MNDLDVRNRADDNCGIIRVDKSVSAKALGIFDKQLHCLLSCRAFLALQHLLFVPG